LIEVGAMNMTIPLSVTSKWGAKNKLWVGKYNVGWTKKIDVCAHSN
jgi:hypothetical protein